MAMKSTEITLKEIEHEARALGRIPSGIASDVAQAQVSKLIALCTELLPLGGGEAVQHIRKHALAHHAERAAILDVARAEKAAKWKAIEAKCVATGVPFFEAPAPDHAPSSALPSGKGIEEADRMRHHLASMKP